MEQDKEVCVEDLEKDFYHNPVHRDKSEFEIFEHISKFMVKGWAYILGALLLIGLIYQFFFS
jgi:hypothetical protein